MYTDAQAISAGRLAVHDHNAVRRMERQLGDRRRSARSKSFVWFV
jgi:hypothetical protein